jgi:hypothetical protein
VVLAAIFGALFALVVMSRRLKAARASRAANDDSGEKPELEDTTIRVAPGLAAAAVVNGHMGGDALELNGVPQLARELPAQPVQEPVELGAN